MGQIIISKRSEFLAFERKQPSVGLERKDALQENSTAAKLPRELFSECKFLTVAALKTVKRLSEMPSCFDCQQGDNSYFFS